MIVIRRIISIIFAIVVIVNQLHGQFNRLIKPNEKIPDSLLKYIPLEREKVTLLDFGACYCVPCMRGLQKIVNMQPIYEKDFKFIFITKESEQRFSAFRKKNPGIENSNAVVITGDTVLNRIFKHTTEPHLVWIGADSVVRAMTNGEYLSERYLSDFLVNEGEGWPIKWDFEFDYDKAIRSFNLNQNILVKPKKWSGFYISSAMPGVLPRKGLVRDSIAGIYRYYAINNSLMKIYAGLFGYHWMSDLFPTDIIAPAEIYNELFYTGVGSQQKWGEEKNYCIEFQTSEFYSESHLNKKLVEWLNVYFSWNVSRRKVKRLCWILKNSPIDRPHNKQKEDGKKGMNLQGLILKINSKPFGFRLINESDADLYKLSLNIPDEHSYNLEYINSLLMNQGLRITEEIREDFYICFDK